MSPPRQRYSVTAAFATYDTGCGYFGTSAACLKKGEALPWVSARMGLFKSKWDLRLGCFSTPSPSQLALESVLQPSLTYPHCRVWDPGFSAVLGSGIQEYLAFLLHLRTESQCHSRVTVDQSGGCLCLGSSGQMDKPDENRTPGEPKPGALLHLSATLNMLFPGFSSCLSTASRAGRGHRTCSGHDQDHDLDVLYRISIHSSTHSSTSLELGQAFILLCQCPSLSALLSFCCIFLGYPSLSTSGTDGAS